MSVYASTGATLQPPALRKPADPIAMIPLLHHSATVVLTAVLATAAPAVAETRPSPSHAAMARELTASIHRTFWMPERSLYRTRVGTDEPETIWGGGVLFPMLTAAARHEPQTYRGVLARFQLGLDSYWDAKVRIPGYEPCPTQGGGNDKYYDDNAWIVIAFAEAAQATGDRSLIRRARETLRFVESGWDKTLGGGIWWHGPSRSRNGPAPICRTRTASTWTRSRRPIDRSTAPR